MPQQKATDFIDPSAARAIDTDKVELDLTSARALSQQIQKLFNLNKSLMQALEGVDVLKIARKLEFVATPTDGSHQCWVAKTPVCNYEISMDRGNAREFVTVELASEDVAIHASPSISSLEELIEKASAHFESTIRACLA